MEHTNLHDVIKYFTLTIDGVAFNETHTSDGFYVGLGAVTVNPDRVLLLASISGDPHRYLTAVRHMIETMLHYSAIVDHTIDYFDLYDITCDHLGALYAEDAVLLEATIQAVQILEGRYSDGNGEDSDA